MATTEVGTEEIMQAIRENRSSEANFDRLLQYLDKILIQSQKK